MYYSLLGARTLDPHIKTLLLYTLIDSKIEKLLQLTYQILLNKIKEYVVIEPATFR